MKSQDQAIDNLVSVFEDKLRDIVAAASREVRLTLGARLSIVDGVIAKTRSNQRILQSVDKMFQRAMDRAGYPALVQAYVKAWGGSFVYFQQSLDVLGEQIGRDLKVKFGTRDLALFAQQQVSATRLLDGVVDQVAIAAERAAMFSVGGLKMPLLIEAVTEKLAVTIPQATTIASTVLPIYYRTIADRGYRIIQRDNPSTISLKYKYGGPNDKFTRPFCRNLLRKAADGVTWTREEIDAMDNHQIPNVFITCGGYNCRHQFYLVARVAEEA